MRWGTTARSRGWCSTPLRRSLFALLALVLAALAATVFRPPPTSGPFARDFEAYYAAGATWNAGGDPWSRDVWRIERTIPGVDATRDELLPFVGPAASLPLWSPLAHLPFAAARTVWVALLALALATLALSALLVAGVRPGIGEAVCAIAFAALSGPAISALALGQIALLAAAALGLALLALERGSPWAIVAACIAALQPNLALPLATRLTAKRPALLLVAAAVLFLAVTLAIGGGIGGLVSYVQRLGVHGAGERFIVIQYALPAIGSAFHLAPAPALVIGDAIAVFTIATIAIVAFRLRAQPRYVALTGIALVPLAVPFFHEHDFTIELIPAIVLAFDPDVRARAFAGIATMCTLVDWLGAAQRPQSAAQTAALAIALACLFCAFGRRSLQPALAPLLACAVLIAALLPLAHAFPAPVWPDALGAFHAPSVIDASAVWSAEQHAAGLDAQVPAWGVLRAVPLGGCVLFAYAALLAARTARTTALARR